MATFTQSLTIKLSSSSLSEADLQAIVDANRDPIAVFILNLLSGDELNSELKFDLPQNDVNRTTE